MHEDKVKLVCSRIVRDHPWWEETHAPVHAQRVAIAHLSTTDVAIWQAHRQYWCRDSASAQSKGVSPPGAFSAHCTVTVAPAMAMGNKYGNGRQGTVFSAIFRQTPTDSKAEEAESEAWEEELVDEGGSECSGGLSGEPSAAHWAEQQDAFGQLV